MRIFTKRKIIALSIILPLIFVIISYLLLPFIYFGIITVFQEARLQKRLLSKTDHQVLLKECRELSQQVMDGELDMDIKTIYEVQYLLYKKKTKLPEIIIDLHPHLINIQDNGIVGLSWGGSMRHFGIHAYPEDYEPPSSKFEFGDKEIIPGLWYDDDLYYRRKDYDKTIDKLLKKNRYNK